MIGLEIGRKYNYLTATKYLYTKGHKDYYELKCDCGKICVGYSWNVRASFKKSCGCHKYMNTKRKKLSHTRCYRAWHSMMFRCYNDKCPGYKNYGGTGIRVAKEWHDFKNFEKDMGHPENNLSLDRIDNNGDYSKDNCRWVGVKEQAINRRTTRLLKHNGVLMSTSDWARHFKIPIGTFSGRIRRGMTVAQAAKYKGASDGQ